MFLSPSVRQKLYEVCLLIGTEHEVYTFDVAYLLCLKLCVTSCNDNKGVRVLAYKLMYGLPAFMVGNLSNRACINKTYISRLIFAGFYHPHLFQRFGKGRCLREIQFASQGMINGFFALKNRTVNHLLVINNVYLLWSK